MHKKFTIFLVIIVIGTVAFFMWWDSRESSEYAAHPDWQTFTDEAGIYTFQYPQKLGTTYITAVDWPPKINLLEGPFSCIETGSEIVPGGKTVQRMIGDVAYCVTTGSEGAAGSIYIQHAYAREKDNQIIVFVFTTREVQCANYDDPQKTECETERASFNIDSVVGEMADTFHFTQTVNLNEKAIPEQN